MSHKPSNERNVKNATPELMREELDNYFAHVQQYDPKNLKFALMVTGHGEAEDDIEMCSMVSGPPQTIARVITELVDRLVERDPAFAMSFLLSFLQRRHDRQNTDESDFDNTSGADVEAQVKDLIGKLRGGTPPNGSVH